MQITFGRFTMIHLRSRLGRRPQHARPSVLAPTRSVATVGGVALAAAAIAAGCAAAAGGEAGAAGNPAPVPTRPASIPALGTMAVGTATVQRVGAGDFGGAPSLVAAAVSGVAGTAGSVAGQAPDTAPVSGLAASGIPSTALAA